MDRIIDSADLVAQLDDLLAEVDAGGTVTIRRPGRASVKLIATDENLQDAERHRAMLDALAHYRRIEPQILRGWTRESLYED